MDDIRLQFPGSGIPDLALGAGVHAIGREDGEGPIGVVDDAQPALLRFCVDRRGVWLMVDERARGVHVNGRPVHRMAMLRVGDAVYVDGMEMLLASAHPAPGIPQDLRNAPADVAIDSRVVLRGVGGRYHGRCFTLGQPRLVGSGADADVRIDDPAFAERHARIDLHDGVVLLRDLGSPEGSVVNGQEVRDAVLNPGDQIVFDGHHRFVIEAPARIIVRNDLPLSPDDGAAETVAQRRQSLALSARRLPWLLLAALLIAAALSALLLFGASA